MAALVAIVALIGYFATRQTNPTTGEVQHISMTAEQEVGLGKQATPEMEAQYGGLTKDPALQQRVESIGQKIVSSSDAKAAPYPFAFHVLADQSTINAFALPGGQVFITEALLKLLQTDGQLAGVLAHEITHVVGRHSAEQAARAQLADGLTGAAVLATYDPNDPNSANNAGVAQMVEQMVNMRFGRADELEADKRGVTFMSEAGYDPQAMVGVMQILDQASQGARPPEFFSTHPDPGHRIEEIQKAIAEVYPNGVPAGLTP
jgi:predicted Zn-dependent protease